MKVCRVIIASLYLCLFLACGDEGQKQEPPEARRARVEDEMATKDDADKRAEIRTTAREFVSRAFPDWKINGVSSYRFAENDYSVSADIGKGEERRTVDVSVRLYVDDDSHTYWKAEYIPGKDEQRMPLYVVRPYQQ